MRNSDTDSQHASTASPCPDRHRTDAGIGIPNGIPEEFNFHLNEAPAYGSHIQPNGHLVVDESLPIHHGTHIVGMENECFTGCGFDAGDQLEYAVVQTNLKSLQLRANWIYVVPTQSKLTDKWRNRPWVRNLERWLVQVDSPGAVAHSTSVDVHKAVFDKENGTAREGLSTGFAAGDTRLAFDVDDRFVATTARGSELAVQVTYWDAGGPFRVVGTA